MILILIFAGAKRRWGDGTVGHREWRSPGIRIILPVRVHGIDVYRPIPVVAQLIIHPRSFEVLAFAHGDTWSHT